MSFVELNIFQIMVAVSYLTLGVANVDTARDLWWIYAIITFFLSIAALYRERKEVE